MTITVKVKVTAQGLPKMPCSLQPTEGFPGCGHFCLPIQGWTQFIFQPSGLEIKQFVRKKKIRKGKMISEFVYKLTLLKLILYICFIYLYIPFNISSLPCTWITLLLAGTFQKGEKWEKLWTAGWVQRRWWHPTPVLLPGKPQGWRSLVGCSPWGHEESDMTERLHFHFSLLCIGEGNGNWLQCSCLENPRDGGAWWAMGRTESDTTEATKQQQQLQGGWEKLCGGPLQWKLGPVQLYLCPILFYLQKKTTMKTQGTPWCSPQVVIWLLVWIPYGKSLAVWVVPGVDLVFVFIFDSESLYPVPAIIPSLWSGDKMWYCCL